MMAERVGIQIRGPKYRGISVGFDLKRASLQPPTVVFDVGAHRGESLDEFARWFPRAYVHCFEPGAEAFAALCRRARKNSRVTCVKAALSDNVGEGTLYVRRGTDNSSLHDYESEHPLEDRRDQETVRVDTIDNYCATQSIDHIDVLKVDTEGLDLSVLAGGHAMFDNGVIGTVQVEAGIGPDNTKHIPCQAFGEFFAKYGYRLFGIYDQVPDWTTGRPALRRCNLVFISPDLAVTSISQQ
jgi:FkbM family methyltransferase